MNGLLFVANEDIFVYHSYYVNLQKFKTTSKLLKYLSNNFCLIGTHIHEFSSTDRLRLSVKSGKSKGFFSHYLCLRSKKIWKLGHLGDSSKQQKSVVGGGV